MKTNIGKSFIVCLCVLVASSSCFQKHIRALTAKVHSLFGNEPCDDVSSTASTWKPNDNDAQPTVSECNIHTDDRNYLFGVDWRNVSSRIANNWWIIAVSSLLPFFVFWRIQYVMRYKLHDWKKSFIQKEKAYTRSRRLTLPDLTLAKHARRESLAESTQKLTNRPKKMSQCNISQFKSIRKNSFERNEELLGDSKRVHLIRRRH
ncbi:uncharacterized protein LOC114119468 [Aphis gossypii]|uniref:Transmembrane protein n=1 Tax=Aphis gossypii TaxID=80765 RepID=A0A9P0IN29_APHGO|nr:uncharacterized protein LOC114119468 [Aphis gossypii]XP_050064317.1 uncharacterized protein LOC114119468 [Aphis gossypii]CAH1709664.1 unnamed protein product [Aphis gossypii]